MHRTRSIAATLAASALVLAACGGGSDDGGGGNAGGGDGEGAAGDLPPCPVDALDAAAGPVTIDYWHAMEQAELETSMIAATDAYNASQDRVVVNLVNQGGYEENFETFRNASSADRPAVVQLPEYYVQAVADSGTTIPAQSCVEASDFDLEPLVDRAVEFYTVEDVLQTMPFNVSTPVLYYNEAMFEAAGLDPDDPPTTFEEVREYSQAIVDSGAATYGIALETQFDAGGGWAIEQSFALAGELYADADNGRDGRATEVLFDGEYGVELFTTLRDLVDDGLAVNVGENPDGTAGLLKMADATEPAAMTIYTSAALSSVVNLLAGGFVPGLGPDQLGIGPFPAATGEGGVTVGGASLWVVGDKSDEETAAAWDFITFLTSAQLQSDWAVGTGYVPVNEESLDLPPLSDTYTTDPRFQVAYDQLVNGEVNAATAGPILGPMRQVRGTTADALQAVLSEGADPATALAEAAEEADALIEDYAQRTDTGG
jgi:sn-glycerol 3-phosphate transport system substrate-binding protein